MPSTMEVDLLGLRVSRSLRRGAPTCRSTGTAQHIAIVVGQGCRESSSDAGFDRAWVVGHRRRNAFPSRDMTAVHQTSAKGSEISQCDAFDISSKSIATSTCLRSINATSLHRDGQHGPCHAVD